MKKSLCELLQDYSPREYEDEDLYSTNIANFVFNSFLSYTAIMLNIVTIHAIRKTSSLPKTLKTLLLSLAVSDVGVGLLNQPFFASLLIKWLHESNPGCNAYKAFYFIGYLFSSASFLGVVAVSADRLRYQERVTHKRVVAVVISIRVLSIFASFSIIWVQRDTFSLIVVIIGTVGVFLATMVYVRIYLVVRRHKNQIQALQVQQQARAGEISKFASLINSAVGIFYVYLMFLICYLPYFISLAAFKVNGPNVTMKTLYLFSLTLLYLNSSLNTVIYC